MVLLLESSIMTK